MRVPCSTERLVITFSLLSYIVQMQSELNSCFETILELRKSISSHSSFSEESLQNTGYIRFYTGLPNFKALKVLFDYVVPPITDVSSTNPTKLDNFQEFMIVLAKFSLDSPLQEFAYRFDISMATVSRIFLSWLTILDVKLGPCSSGLTGKYYGRQHLLATELLLARKLSLYRIASRYI